jgi:iron complex outermembrane receptor protein
MTSESNYSRKVVALVTAFAFCQALPASAAAPDVQASPAAPAAATEPASEGLQEILVTARRRSESLQQTPVAITAFSQQELQSHSIGAIEDLSAQTPSLSFQQSPYDSYGSFIGLRGQQATDIVISQTPPVGIYVDDVYYPTTLATSLENFEGVQQIEVLKGPQGTLYGRNTTGGAIKITTKLPDYDGISGSLKVGYGNYDQTSVAGTLNLPLVNQVASLSVVGQYAKDSGYGKDVPLNLTLDRNESEALRAALRLDLADNFQVVVRGEWAHAVGTQNIENLSYVAPGFTIGSAAVAAQIGALSGGDFAILGGLLTKGAPPAGTTPGQLATFFGDINKGRNALASYICKSPPCRDVYYPTPSQLTPFGLTGLALVPSSSVNIATGSVSATYAITPNLSLKSISAYQYTSRQAVASTSASPFLLIEGFSDDQNPRQLTQELQFGGSALEDKLKWVTGYYYFNLYAHDNSNPSIQLVPFVPNPVSYLVRYKDVSNSGFGQATYALTSTLNATVGVRYTSEQTTLISGQHNAAVCNVQGVPPTAVGAACQNTFPNSFANTSYTAGLDWQALPTLMLYAKTSRGFRAGGTNQRSNPALPFAPEIVKDYEVGAKSDWLDRRLRVNVAVYRSEYSEIQRSIYVKETSSFVTAIQNAASATINGVEAEITARPIEPLILTASVAYTDPKYNSYTGLSSTGVPLNLSGNGFPNVSRWQTGLSGTYTVDDPWGPIAATLDFSYRSTVDYQPDNHDAFSAPYTIQPGYGLLNARLSQGFASSRVRVSLWGKNVTNRRYYAGANDFSTQLGYAYTIPGRPATYGVEVSKQF